MALMIGLLSIVVILLFIWIIFIWLRLRKMKKQFNQLLRGSDNDNLEEVLVKLFSRMEDLEQSNQSQHEALGLMKQAIDRKKGNVGVVRFNAFVNEGSGLSFSIAVVDEREDGFVLTSIYGRQESRIYAKPLANGKSVYHLTDEELEAIEKAKQT